MAQVTVGDVELYYEIHGEGPPVVLIHGLAGDCGAWAPQINVLESGYKIIALDNRGAGRSSAPDYPYTTAHSRRRSQVRQNGRGCHLAGSDAHPSL